MTREARHLQVHGDVQGVFFRDSTRKRARSNEVAGWVRNNPDGTVEAWLEGAPEALDRIEQWMREGGPPRARVERVETAAEDPRGLEAFEVRH